jgi:hypothetical protein
VPERLIAVSRSNGGSGGRVAGSRIARLAGEGGRWMTFKLERRSDGGRWVVRMIGAAKSEHLGEIAEQLDLCGPWAALDLEEVTVVGADVVRFLLARERQGTELLHCPAYIREWIAKEGKRT